MQLQTLAADSDEERLDSATATSAIASDQPVWLKTFRKAYQRVIHEPGHYSTVFVSHWIS